MKEWKNNFNFVKNVKTMYENFITIVIIISEKQIVKHYSSSAFALHPNSYKGPT